MPNLTTIVGRSKFCDKIFRTVLVQREGFSAQVQIQVWGVDIDSVELKLRSTLALRVGPAREVAAALLAAVHAYEGTATVETQS